LELYVLGKDAVTVPGLSLLSSLLFYGYVGLLTHADLTQQARRWAVVVFALMCLLSLFRGSRGEAFAQLLVGAWLYFYTGRSTPSLTFWAALLGGLILIAEGVSMLRSGVGLDERDTSVPTQLAWFVYTQGLSGELVAAADDSFGVGPQNLRFLFAPLLAPVRQLTDRSFGTQTDQYGRSSSLLAHELAYRADPDLYLAGRGLGSTYLAEVHCAFGVLGVVLVTAAIVWFLGVATCRAGESTSILYLLACVLPYVLFIPRESLLLFVTPALKAAALLVLYRSTSNPRRSPLAARVASPV
jgi:oligosaccharide repeat unit polymerase